MNNFKESKKVLSLFVALVITTILFSLFTGCTSLNKTIIYLLTFCVYWFLFCIPQMNVQGFFMNKNYDIKFRRYIIWE